MLRPVLVLGLGGLRSPYRILDQTEKTIAVVGGWGLMIDDGQSALGGLCSESASAVGGLWMDYLARALGKTCLSLGGTGV